MDEDIRSFLETLKTTCMEREYCQGCPFCQSEWGGCILEKRPSLYNIDRIYAGYYELHDNYEEYRNPVVKIKLFPGGRMPEKKTAGAAAYDCYARVCDGMQDEWVFFDEGKNKYYLYTTNGRTGKYPLGFALEMPPGVHAFVMARSSMGLKTQLICPIGVGLIDSDYRGEVAMLYEGYDPDKDKGSAMDAVNRIYDGDRIAQLLFNVPVELVQVDELTPTERGNGGFGSTGKR